jgi:hypothetical protein
VRVGVRLPAPVRPCTPGGSVDRKGAQAARIQRRAAWVGPVLVSSQSSYELSSLYSLRERPPRSVTGKRMAAEILLQMSENDGGGARHEAVAAAGGGSETDYRSRQHSAGAST